MVILMHFLKLVMFQKKLSTDVEWGKETIFPTLLMLAGKSVAEETIAALKDRNVEIMNSKCDNNNIKMKLCNIKDIESMANKEKIY